MYYSKVWAEDLPGQRHSCKYEQPRQDLRKIVLARRADEDSTICEASFQRASTARKHNTAKAVLRKPYTKQAQVFIKSALNKTL